MRIIIATIKSWNIDNAKRFADKYSNQHTIHILTKKEELDVSFIDLYKPDYIFFPHWSYIIPDTIYDKYECVVFHMTDLPYGRGGSPLQNLIVRGHKETKISAIKVIGEIDAGSIYLKKHLDLSGTATDIYQRASDIIFEEMIPQFLDGKLIAKKQQGKVVTFKRRKPEESEITSDMTLAQIYDYIRMLDAEGYPNAYIKYGDFKLSFSQAKFSGDSLNAKVNISKNIIGGLNE